MTRLASTSFHAFERDIHTDVSRWASMESMESTPNDCIMTSYNPELAPSPAAALFNNLRKPIDFFKYKIISYFNILERTPSFMFKCNITLLENNDWVTGMDIIINLPKPSAYYALGQFDDAIPIFIYEHQLTFGWRMPEFDSFSDFIQDQPVEVTLQSLATAKYIGIGSRLKLAGEPGSYLYAIASDTPVKLSVTRRGAGDATHMPMTIQTTSGSKQLWGGYNMDALPNLIWEKVENSSDPSPGFNTSLIARTTNSIRG